MKKMLALLCIPLVVLPLIANASSDEETLTRMLNEFLAGASVNDIAAHERFWGDDLVYTSSSGHRFGKADIIVRNSPEDEASAQGPSIAYSAEEIRIRLYGDTAVVAFRLIGNVQEEPPELLQYFNTGTFVRQDGEWRVVAWQATVIPEATD